MRQKHTYDCANTVMIRLTEKGRDDRASSGEVTKNTNTNTKIQIKTQYTQVHIYIHTQIHNMHKYTNINTQIR